MHSVKEHATLAGTPPMSHHNVQHVLLLCWQLTNTQLCIKQPGKQPAAVKGCDTLARLCMGSWRNTAAGVPPSQHSVYSNVAALS